MPKQVQLHRSVLVLSELCKPVDVKKLPWRRTRHSCSQPTVYGKLVYCCCTCCVGVGHDCVERVFPRWLQEGIKKSSLQGFSWGFTMAVMYIGCKFSHLPASSCPEVQLQLKPGYTSLQMVLPFGLAPT